MAGARIQILFGRSNQGESGGLSMWHAVFKFVKVSGGEA
jgi:hypothetical protein